MQEENENCYLEDLAVISLPFGLLSCSVFYFYLSHHRISDMTPCPSHLHDMTTWKRQTGERVKGIITSPPLISQGKERWAVPF